MFRQFGPAELLICCGVSVVPLSIAAAVAIIVAVTRRRADTPQPAPPPADTAPEAESD